MLFPLHLRVPPVSLRGTTLPESQARVRPQDRRQEGDSEIQPGQSDESVDDPGGSVGSPERLSEDFRDQIPTSKSATSPQLRAPTMTRIKARTLRPFMTHILYSQRFLDKMVVPPPRWLKPMRPWPARIRPIK